MVFDRISLIDAYNVLKVLNDNDGPVTNILFNKTAFYGTKTVPRFATLADLKTFINTKYPYKYYEEDCECATENESIYTLLAFEVGDKPKYDIFVNNMRTLLDSAKKATLNEMSVKITKEIFSKNTRLDFLFDNYVCFAYIQDQGEYVYPCDYIEIIKNIHYTEVIRDFYSKTRYF